MEERLGEILGLGIASALAIIIALARKRILPWLEKVFTRPKYLESDDVKLDREIREILAELRVSLGARSAYVIQFHNGHKFSSRQPTWRMTMTHEVVGDGIAYRSQQMIGMPCGIVIEYLSPFWGLEEHEMPKGVSRFQCNENDKEDVFCYDVSQMAESMYRSMLKDRGVASSLLTPIYNMNGNGLIGVVGVDYDTSVECEKWSEVSLVAAARESISYQFYRYQ